MGNIIIKDKVMGKLLYVLLCSCVMLLWACDKKIQDKNVLLHGISSGINATSPVKLSELLGKKCRLIPLETKPDVLIGMVKKVIKFQNKYYVSSANRIGIFDRHGHFETMIDHLGRGAGEYPELCDFEVYDNNGNTEVWICYAHKILVYDAISGKHLRDMNYKSFIHKFICLGNGKLLLMTGLEKDLIAVADTSGHIYQTAMEKKPTNVMFKAIQFYPLGDKIVYQMDMSSACMVYNPQEECFEEMDLIPRTPDVLTGTIYDEMFKEKAEEAWRDVRNYTLVSAFALYDKKRVVCLSKERKSLLSVWDSKTGEVKTVEYKPNTNYIINDLYGLQDYSYFHTFKATMSDDHSLIMIVGASVLVDAREKQKDVEVPLEINRLKEDDNPVLIEFFK